MLLHGALAVKTLRQTALVPAAHEELAHFRTVLRSPDATRIAYKMRGTLVVRAAAYHATGAGGIEQVSVVPFPPTGERWQISGDGGVQPRWAPGGEELFYLDRTGRLVSVALPGGDPRRAGAPRPLYDTGLQVSSSFDQFAVGPKDRFLFRTPFGIDPGVPVHVILGWDRPTAGAR